MAGTERARKTLNSVSLRLRNDVRIQPQGPEPTASDALSVYHGSFALSRAAGRRQLSRWSPDFEVVIVPLNYPIVKHILARTILDPCKIHRTHGLLALIVAGADRGALSPALLRRTTL